MRWSASWPVKILQEYAKLCLEMMREVAAEWVGVFALAYMAAVGCDKVPICEIELVRWTGVLVYQMWVPVNAVIMVLPMLLCASE